MKQNMGTLDRALRAVVGIVLAAAGAFAGLSTGAMIFVFVVAAVMLVTAVVGFCPLYAPLGWNTGRRDPPATPKTA